MAAKSKALFVHESGSDSLPSDRESCNEGDVNSTPHKQGEESGTETVRLSVAGQLIDVSWDDLLDVSKWFETGAKAAATPVEPVPAVTDQD
jgi:hypothetical protein